MNVFFHFLFNYLFVDVISGNAWGQIPVIFAASVLIDLTHVPYLLKVRTKVVEKRFGSEARTRFHELYGLALISAALCVLYTVYFPYGNAVIGTAAACIALHFSLDFLSGRSMPFYPFSKKEVFLHIFPYGYRNKVLFEAASTLILGVLFWSSIAGLVS